MSLTISSLIVLSSTIWVFFDAKKLWKNIEVQKNEEIGPKMWVVGCLLLWIVAFPFYIAKRATMKKLVPEINTTASTVVGSIVFLALIINVAAPSMGWVRVQTSDLQNEVLASVQETFAQDSELSTVKVKSLTLIHAQGNRYNGILYTEYDGTDTNLNIDVTYDGENFMWQLR